MITVDDTGVQVSSLSETLEEMQAAATCDVR